MDKGAIAELQRRCPGRVWDSVEKTGEYERDFGGFVRRRPAAVFRPADRDDLVLGLRTAREHGLTVSIRGSGHSQFGQCLGSGLVIDMRGFDQAEIRDDMLVVGAGASWRQVMDRTYAAGYRPRGLTHAADPTVAGTLSVAGIGSQSWLHGPQVDNIAWLDVARIDGEILRCSPTENRELFDMVRGGMGQCGVIVEVGYPIDRCGQELRVWRFAYSEPEPFVTDMVALCERPDAFRFASSALLNQGGQPVMVLRLGQDLEGGAPPAGEPPVGGHARALPPTDGPLWSASGRPGHPFFQVTAPDIEPAAVLNGYVRPWVDFLFSTEAFIEVLDVLWRHPPAALQHGSLGMNVVRRGVEPAPMFVVPEPTDLNWTLGLLPRFPMSSAEAGQRMVLEYLDLLAPFGGKRYLSGFMPFLPAPPQAHFGDLWPRLHRAKRRLDPDGLLGPGFIDWPSEAEPV